MYAHNSSRLLRASSDPASAAFISARTAARTGADLSRSASYPHAFSAAATWNNGSLVSSVTAAPPRSILATCGRFNGFTVSIWWLAGAGVGGTTGSEDEDE